MSAETGQDPPHRLFAVAVALCFATGHRHHAPLNDGLTHLDTSGCGLNRRVGRSEGLQGAMTRALIPASMPSMLCHLSGPNDGQLAHNPSTVPPASGRALLPKEAGTSVKRAILHRSAARSLTVLGGHLKCST
jgi:hypothetical protein